MTSFFAARTPSSVSFVVRSLGAVEELGELRPGHAGGELGEPLRRDLGEAAEPLGRADRFEVLAALREVGTRDLDLAGRRGAHQLRVELGEALGDQHDDDVLGEQHRVLRPLAQVDQHGAVLRRAVGGVAVRHQGLGERQDQHHRPGRCERRAVAEVRVEEGEGIGGVARQRLAPGGPVDRVVGLQAVDEMLLRRLRGEAEPLRPVVGDLRRPRGEERVGQEAVEELEGEARFLAHRDQVRRQAVDHERIGLLRGHGARESRRPAGQGAQEGRGRHVGHLLVRVRSAGGGGGTTVFFESRAPGRRRRGASGSPRSICGMRAEHALHLFHRGVVGLDLRQHVVDLGRKGQCIGRRDRLLQQQMQERLERVELGGESGAVLGVLLHRLRRAGAGSRGAFRAPRARAARAPRSPAGVRGARSPGAARLSSDAKAISSYFCSSQSRRRNEARTASNFAAWSAITPWLAGDRPL